MNDKAKAMLMLGLLNDAFGDVRNLIYYMRDFVNSHQDWSEDIKRYGIYEVIKHSEELEKIIARSMDRLKEIVYG